jgi:PAS domain S-box-containing protein
MRVNGRETWRNHRVAEDDVRVSIPVPRHDPAPTTSDSRLDTRLDSRLDSLDAVTDRVAWQLAVDAAGVGAFVWDLPSDHLRWDGRLLELFGLDEESFGGTIDSFNQCVHPDDRARVRHALERAVATCGDYGAEYRVVLPDGSVRWIEARGRVLADHPGGPAVRLVGAAYDISSRREATAALDRNAERLALLASVSEALISTLDPIESVGLLATLLVPELADWCLVTLVEDPHASTWPRGLRDVAWSHADPAMAATLADYASLRIRALTDSSYLARAIRETHTVLLPTEATDRVSAVLAPGAARDRLRQLDPASAVIVPLQARGRTVGVVSVFRGTGRAAFTADDQALLEDVASRAALALDNARLYASQRDVAEALQRSMLTEPPQPDHLQIATRYAPSRDAARIGGDWYDAFLQQSRGPAGHDVVVVVGDVVGHDVAAAAAMGQVRGLLRGIAVHSGYAPAAILSGVDEVMESLRLETTATAVVARIERHPRPGAHAGEEVVLRWAHAGHPSALMLCPSGEVTRLADMSGNNDLLLGLDPGTQRVEHVAFLEPGSVLVLYTDGLVERRDRDVEDGIDTLADLLRDLAPVTPDLEELCDRLLAGMTDDKPEDDVALLVVRLAPA